MAASASTGVRPQVAVAAETAQRNFERGVAFALHLWPALTLAVQNHWGGHDSEDKRDWFAGAIVDMFPDWTKQQKLPQRGPDAATQQNGATGVNDNRNGISGSIEEPEMADVEAVLLQVMLDEFEVNVDDDSSFEVADQIIRLRADCAKGRSDEFDTLERRWKSKKGAQVASLFKKGQDEENETDWSTDEASEEDSEEGDDGEPDDVVMVDAPPSKTEKPEPEIDEDGFTKVTRKRR